MNKVYESSAAYDAAQEPSSWRIVLLASIMMLGVFAGISEAQNQNILANTTIQEVYIE